MSWRDRLVWDDPTARAGRITFDTEAIGANGTNDYKTISAKRAGTEIDNPGRGSLNWPTDKSSERLVNRVESVDSAAVAHRVRNNSGADSVFTADRVEKIYSASGNPDVNNASTADSPAASGATWNVGHEERVAIIEYDGKVPRTWAEGFARLHSYQPPVNVGALPWRIFVDDVGRFLDGPFCGIAASLGWGPFDLFGADRDRPFARIDQAGLLWLLNGDRLVALSENEATIETRTGARQTLRRKTSEAGRALAWELE
jgi:hypothetical protein